jgi:anti-anti-sigma factor
MSTLTAMMRAADNVFTIELVVHGIDASLAFVGELDVVSAARLQAVVRAVIDMPGVLQLRIDGRGVEFVDSAGLCGLLLSRADARLAGRSWRLDALSPALQRLLDLAGSPGLLSDPAVN